MGNKQDFLKQLKQGGFTEEEYNFIAQVVDIVGDPDLIGKIPRSVDYKANNKNISIDQLSERSKKVRNSTKGFLGGFLRGLSKGKGRQFDLPDIQKFFPNINEPKKLKALQKLINSNKNILEHSFLQIDDHGQKALTQLSHERLTPEGGFGKIKEAKKWNGAHVLVKMPKKNELAQAFAIQEAEHTRNLIFSPNFKLYEGEQKLGDTQYLVLGKFKGSDLYGCYQDSQIQNWDFTQRLARVLHITAQIDAIHQQNKAHLDLKLENVLIGEEREDSNPNVLVIDFGLTENIQNGAQRDIEGERGTPGYVAPELLHPPHTMSTKADAYSLGIMMLEIFYPMILIQAEGASSIWDLTDPSQSLTLHPPEITVLIGNENYNNKHYQELADLIQEMVSHELKFRPESSDACQRLYEILKELNPALAEAIGKEYGPLLKEIGAEKSWAAQFSEAETIPSPAKTSASVTGAPDTDKIFTPPNKTAFFSQQFKSLQSSGKDLKKAVVSKFKSAPKAPLPIPKNDPWPANFTYQALGGYLHQLRDLLANEAQSQEKEEKRNKNFFLNTFHPKNALQSKEKRNLIGRIDNTIAAVITRDGAKPTDLYWLHQALEQYAPKNTSPAVKGALDDTKFLIQNYLETHHGDYLNRNGIHFRETPSHRSARPSLHHPE